MLWGKGYQSSQEHLKTIMTIIYTKFGGKTECIRGGIFENRERVGRSCYGELTAVKKDIR